MRIALCETALLTLFAAGTALAQPAPPVVAPPGAPSTVVETESNQVGGGADRIVAPGATGASTIQSDSADGGNAGQPSRRVPQGSGSGGGGNN